MYAYTNDETFWEDKFKMDFPGVEFYLQFSYQENYRQHCIMWLNRVFEAGHEETIQNTLEWGAGLQQGIKAFLAIGLISHSRSYLLPWVSKVPGSWDEMHIGQTPLIFAAKRNDVYVTLFLLEQKADVDAKTSFGHTALDYASLYKSNKVKDILLDHGASYNKYNTHLSHKKLDFDDE
jgi:hypothetical protein